MTKLKILILFVFLVNCVAQYMIWFYAPVEVTMGLVQKIFYLHMPLAIWSFASFFVVFIASLMCLFRRVTFWYALAGSAAEVGVLFSGLALVTGSIWGRAVWNVWWTWDPRLTTTLIMWFVYVGYLLLRSLPMGEERRALVCAALGVIAFMDVPLVFYSARLWRGVHPAVFEHKSGSLEPEMLYTLLVGMFAMGLLWICLLIACHGQERLAGKVSALRVHFLEANSQQG